MHNYTENQKTNFTIFSCYHNSILTSQLKKKIATTTKHMSHQKKCGLNKIKNIYGFTIN